LNLLHRLAQEGGEQHTIANYLNLHPGGAVSGRNRRHGFLRQLRELFVLAHASTPANRAIFW
jgi:hypothetical protein